MIRTLFEQFVSEPDICCYAVQTYLDKTVYFYDNAKKGVKMSVLVDTPFKYTPEIMQELVHTGYLKVVQITIC